MRYAIGMDIGGHSVRAVLCDEEGNFAVRHSSPVDREATTAQANIDIVVSVIETVLQEAGLSPGDLSCAAVGIPGMTDTEKGLVILCPNLPGWCDLPLKGVLEERLGVPFTLENDVNLAAIGEYWKGAAQGHSNFFFLALGTGIGGGVFVNGRLYRGPGYGAAEVGYAVLHPQQGDRRLGDLGWLESIASGLAIQQSGRDAARRSPDSVLGRMATDPQQITPKLVFEAARRGDPAAMSIIEEVTTYLALTVVNITALLDPELIIFGGGVSRQGEALLGPVREKAQGFGIGIPLVCQSKLKDEAQLYGAVYAALKYAGAAD